ncbi:MAG: ABC transporter permease [Bacteroidales bacterium]|jgi:ABC-2 type transport system permease protein|nr:ABC transporter permease [Bacteroidales bacterium]
MIRRVLYIARKELISIYRDKMSMTILVVLPLVIVGILGNVLRFELIDVKFALLDKSGSNLFLPLVSELDASNEFSFGGNLNSEREILPAFINDDIEFVVSIPSNFNRGDKLTVFVDGSLLLMSEAITQRLSLLNSEDYPFEISYRYNEELKSEMEPLPGLIMIALVIVASIMLSLSINRERERGTARMLILTPARMSEIIAGKSLPYLAVSLIHGLSVYLLSLFMFGIEINQGIANFFLLTLLFSVASMMTGLFIASIVKNELELLIGCWLFIFIPNVFFSGFIFPLQSMESLIIPYASLIPGSLFIEAYKGIVFRISSLEINLKYFVLLVLQSLLFYLVALYLFKRNFFRK